MEGKSVLCLNVIPEFIIPNHINQKMVSVSGRTLWRRCCVLVGSSRNEKQTMRKVTLSRPVHNTASLRWGELMLNADNALPVSIVLDPSVRIIMGELRGRSGPATKRRDRATGEGVGEKNNICESNQEVLITPNVHIHACTNPMNPLESDEGEW